MNIQREIPDDKKVILNIAKYLIQLYPSSYNPKDKFSYFINIDKKRKIIKLNVKKENKK